MSAALFTHSPYSFAGASSLVGTDAMPELSLCRSPPTQAPTTPLAIPPPMNYVRPDPIRPLLDGYYPQQRCAASIRKNAPLPIVVDGPPAKAAIPSFQGSPSSAPPTAFQETSSPAQSWARHSSNSDLTTMDENAMSPSEESLRFLMPAQPIHSTIIDEGSFGYNSFNSQPAQWTTPMSYPQATPHTPPYESLSPALSPTQSGVAAAPQSPPDSPYWNPACMTAALLLYAAYAPNTQTNNHTNKNGNKKAGKHRSTPSSLKSPTTPGPAGANPQRPGPILVSSCPPSAATSPGMFPVRLIPKSVMMPPPQLQPVAAQNSRPPQENIIPPTSFVPPPSVAICKNNTAFLAPDRIEPVVMARSRQSSFGSSETTSIRRASAAALVIDAPANPTHFDAPCYDHHHYESPEPVPLQPAPRRRSSNHGVSLPPKPISAPGSPPCDHVTSWKRLRAKRGFGHYLCLDCGAKWKTPSYPFPPNSECAQN